jgi:hypothetical protein
MAAAHSDDILLGQVRTKRAEVERFLSRALPQRRRLLNTTILGGTVAAALTAAPAVGGQAFTKWLAAAFSLTSPAWQLLCGAATVSSIAATVATQVLKSNNVDEHVARAQTCRARLEVLDVGLSTGRLEPAQAATEYMKCVEDVAFIERRP